MSYIPLGWRKLIAAADTTGLNASTNYTNAFNPQTLNINVAVCEVYHAVVSAGTPTSQLIPAPCIVYLNSMPYSFTFPISGSEWDPAEPMLIRPGDEVDFCWQLATSQTPAPVVTLYLRYDPALPGNQHGG